MRNNFAQIDCGCTGNAGEEIVCQLQLRIHRVHGTILIMYGYLCYLAHTYFVKFTQIGLIFSLLFLFTGMSWNYLFWSSCRGCSEAHAEFEKVKSDDI